MEEGRQAAGAETLRKNESPSPPLASRESRPKDFGFTNFIAQPSPCLTPVSRKSGGRWMDLPLIFSCHQNCSLLSLELPDTSDTPRGGFVHIPPFPRQSTEGGSPVWTLAKPRHSTLHFSPQSQGQRRGTVE